MANGEETETKSKGSPWVDLLTSAREQLVPVLVTAGSLVGFVAFAGAVIVWTRFAAAKVPPDQAVAALPQNELVAIGSSFLLLFGFFGVLAVLAVFLIDRGGRATPGMSRALLLLLMAEGVVAIVLVDGPSVERSIVAIELFLLPMAVVFWSTFATPFIRLNENLPDRHGDEPEAELRDGPFLLVAGGFSPGRKETKLALGVMAGCALVAALATWHLFGSSLTTAAMVGVATLGSGLGLAVVLHCIRFYRGEEEREKKWKRRRKRRERRRRAARKRDLKREEALHAEGKLLEATKLRKEREAREAPKDPDGEKAKPPRLELTGRGAVLMVVMTAVAVAGPAWWLEKIWLAAALASALILVAGLWRIADLAQARFLWYGLAVFISVPLFGTLTAMARNLDDPQVQPMALIRNTDGPDEAIQGLYVTEGDDRIYFATVSTEGCSDSLTPHSGRLLWVPKSEVVAMAVGPLQSVDDAAKTSLEMAYSLTPAVETSGGGHVNPPTSEQHTVRLEAPSHPEDRRLENVGAAVRPNFGAGWSLSPATASPGDVVTLRMSSPNEEGEVEGFGKRREGRTLRLGGVRVDVLKERAPSPWEAEYVETSEGEALKLEKGSVYVRRDSPKLHFIKVEDPRPVHRPYVKLVDKSVLRVRPGVSVPVAQGDEAGLYLPLIKGAESLLHPRKKVDMGERDKRPMATTKDGKHVRLEYRLLRQAWHPDHIRFRVPENATSGAVSVECNQLASGPLLRVSHPPTARIAVQMQAGSDRVFFDSRLSKDHDGKIESRRWTIEGIGRGHTPRVDEDLPPRDTPYTVRLTVTDSEQHTDTAEVRLFRLRPAQLDQESGGSSSGGASASSAPTGPTQLHAILANSVVKEPNSELEMDSYVARPGSPPDGDLEASAALDRRAGRKLLTESGLPTTFPAGGVPIRALAYGDRCPPALHESLRRRIDIFVLGDGAQVLPPRGCHPGQVEHTDW